MSNLLRRIRQPEGQIRDLEKLNHFWITFANKRKKAPVWFLSFYLG